MAEDVHGCLTSLLESLPGWIADLENIVKAATERQKDILRENQPADSAQSRSRKASKTSSVRSRRSKGSKQSQEEKEVTKSESPENALLETQLPHMTQSDALRLAQRKRKTASACTDRQSGPLKYRSKSMVVVYYDGETQKQFETIVRAIGSSRNALRRGKMSAKVDALSRAESSKKESSDDGHMRIGSPTLNYTSTRLRLSPTPITNDGTEVFDKIDAFLEKAQTMCERSAHQVLRDGDCGIEIKWAKEQFADAQRLSKAELPIWQKRAEEAAERQRQSEERRLAEEEEQEATPPPEYTSTDQLSPEDPFSSPPALEVDLEPDDSDGGEDQDFAVSHMQLGRPYFRSTRLIAH